MHFLADYGMFLLEVITMVAAIIIVLIAFFGLLASGKKKQRGKISIKHLNEQFAELAKTMQQEVLSKTAFKRWQKGQQKADKKTQKKTDNDKPRIFVVQFNGDMRAQAVAALRQEITAILSVVKADDEVVVNLESPGGMVHAYGLAASQLQRIKTHKIKLTVCVDKVAASGGYMMACIADTIIAAPFAIIGSIGVVAQLPNFHRWLDKHDIDIEQITAGNYKRTLTMFGENTPEKRQKFSEQVQETHDLFKQFVSQHRAQLDIEQVATGEYWYGSQALPLQLIDQLGTSDDYLLAAHEHANIYEVTYHVKKSLGDKLFHSAKQSSRAWHDFQQQQQFDASIL